MEKVREKTSILGILKNVFSSLGSNETEPQNDEERIAILEKEDPENIEEYKETNNYISKNLESMFREGKKVKTKNSRRVNVGWRENQQKNREIKVKIKEEKDREIGD